MKTFDFDEELVRLRPSLMAFARSLCHNSAKAEDLVQDTFVKALANCETFVPGTNLRAWLFTIMRNHYYSELRKNWRMVEDAEGKHAARVPVRPDQEGAADLADLRRAFVHLTPDHRKVLNVLTGGASYKEASQECRCAVGTVKSRGNRARAKLRTLLDIEP